MTFKKQNKRFITDAPGEFGSICWSVESEDYHRSKCNSHMRRKDASLRIADCYKVISLEFDYYDFDQYQSRLDKIDNLIESLVEFRSALVESWGKP